MGIQIRSMPSRFAPFIATILCWLFLCAAHSLPTANAQKATSTAQNYVLRTYEVGDIVLNIQDRPYNDSSQKSPAMISRGGGSFGGGGLVVPGGGPVRAGSPPDTARITIDELLAVLINTVDPVSWAKNSGLGKGDAMYLGTALVVRQTQEVHKQIEELLRQLRQGSANRRTLTIDARWLLLDSDELKKLLLENQAGLPEVNREVLAEFTRRPSSIRGITNCFSSQLVYLVSGTRQDVVKSYIPVVGSLEHPNRDQQYAFQQDKPMIRLASQVSTASLGQSSVGYQPVIEQHNFGALLEIRPTLIPNGSAAVVDVFSTITVSGEQLPKSNVGIVGIKKSHAIAPELDRPAVETQQFATTLRLPLGKPILVGGLTQAPMSTALTKSKGQAAAGTLIENPQLYFVLEVR